LAQIKRQSARDEDRGDGKRDDEASAERRNASGQGHRRDTNMSLAGLLAIDALALYADRAR
jgi:hypothetical protein